MRADKSTLGLKARTIQTRAAHHPPPGDVLCPYLARSASGPRGVFDGEGGRGAPGGGHTAWLNEQKQYRVIRFTNRDVMNNLAAVLEAIRAAL